MISRRNMVDVIVRFRNLCVRRYPDDIDVLSKDKRDKRLGIARNDLSDMLAPRMTVKPIDHICRLAKTPRLLKLILRRTYRIWERLHGEVDFDELLVATTLRFGAPEAFEFLLEHHSEIRGLFDRGSDEDYKVRQEAVGKKWDRAVIGVKWDTASANSLAQFLFPRWVTRNGFFEEGLLQSMRIFEPTDYWSRYLAEELDPNRVRDQEILHGLVVWRKDDHGPYFRGATLPLVLCSDKEFSSKFEHLAPVTLTGQEIRQIASATFEQALALQGVKACRDSVVGFIPLWRLAIRQPIDETEHLEWVKNEIFKALSKSLRFANDIYYYWISNSEADVQGKPDRVELRNQVVSHAKNIFAGKPHDFIGVIDPHDMCSSYRFRGYLKISDEGESAFITDRDDWFSKLLLDAGELNPQVIVPQITCLLTDEQHSFEGNFREGLSNELFEKEMLRLMHILSTEINLDSFDLREKRRIQTAREVATEWLKENPL